jgi:hypothetical protein
MSEAHEKDLIMSLTLAHSILAWWEDHKDDNEPEFVKLAKELING